MDILEVRKISHSCQVAAQHDCDSECTHICSVNVSHVSVRPACQALGSHATNQITLLPAGSFLQGPLARNMGYSSDSPAWLGGRCLYRSLEKVVSSACYVEISLSLAALTHGRLGLVVSFSADWRTRRNTYSVFLVDVSWICIAL